MAGKFSKIAKLVKSMHLRAITDIKFSFDPYRDNVRSIREILFTLHTPRMINTNERVNLKIDIKSDRSDPVIDIKFVDGHKMIFKTKYLATDEILERLNVVCAEKDPKLNEPATLTTKSAKKRR